MPTINAMSLVTPVCLVYWQVCQLRQVFQTLAFLPENRHFGPTFALINKQLRRATVQK